MSYTIYIELLKLKTLPQYSDFLRPTCSSILKINDTHSTSPKCKSGSILHQSVSILNYMNDFHKAVFILTLYSEGAAGAQNALS